MCSYGKRMSIHHRQRIGRGKTKGRVGTEDGTGTKKRRWRLSRLSRPKLVVSQTKGRMGTGKDGTRTKKWPAELAWAG